MTATYTPAGPGAVLKLGVDTLADATSILPLATAGLIDIELIELRRLEL